MSSNLMGAIAIFFFILFNFTLFAPYREWVTIFYVRKSIGYDLQLFPHIILMCSRSRHLAQSFDTTNFAIQ